MMAVGMRPKLGLNLQSIVAGDQPWRAVPHPLPGGSPGEPAPKPNGGFFKEGGLGRILAGSIGDILLQNAGMRPVYAPMMQQRQQSAQEEAQWSRRRQAENEDWKARETWKLANDKPADDQFTRMLRASGIDPMSETGRAMYRQKIENETDPLVTTTLPNGQFYSGPRSGLAAALTGQMAAPAVPVAPVGKLRPVGGAAASGTPPFAVRTGFAPKGIPGERITSTLRSPAKNKAVGGVANSFHLTGQARDSVPPPGMSMAAYAAELRRANPHLDVINEGDHVHLEPKGR